MRRFLESSVCAVVLLMEASAMSAPPPPEPPEPPPQKEMRERANLLVKEGRLADARDLHLSLWRINGRPANAFNIGMLSYRIRDFATAAEYLTIWLDRVGPLEAPKVPTTTALDKGQYEQARVDLQEALKQVEAIRVNVSDPGADVLIDNRRIGVSPLKFPVFVSPGRHRVVAQLGGVQVEEIIAATAGGERTVRLMLPGTPAATTTTRTDKPRKAPPAVGLASKPSPWARWLPVGGLAAASVGLGIFGGFAVSSANNAADERTDALFRVRHESANGCPGGPSCKDFTDADGRAKTMTALSVGAFIGAGLAAAGAGAAAYLLAPEAPVRVGSAPDAIVSVSW